MKKLLIAEFYVLLTVVSCALKSAELISLSWAEVLLIPAAVAFGYLALVLILSGALVFDVTCIHNKQFKKRTFVKA